MLKSVKAAHFESLMVAGRHYARYDKNLPAQVFNLDNEQFESCIVKNLSRGGACLHVGNLNGLKAGDEILVTFLLKKLTEPLMLESTIRWIDVHNKVLGVEFEPVLEEKDVA